MGGREDRTTGRGGFPDKFYAKGVGWFYWNGKGREAGLVSNNIAAPRIRDAGVEVHVVYSITAAEAILGML